VRAVAFSDSWCDAALSERLAGSVRERGVLQPVLVRPLPDGKYGLIVGERRWRAAKLAGLETIPALVSPYDDAEALEAGLIENMARENLNPVEEARACATLVSELGMTHQQIADRVGRGHVTVWNLMHLLELSDELLELLERGELSKSHGTALLVAKDPQVRSRLAREAIEQGWSTRTREARARASNMALESQEDVGNVKAESGEGLDSAHQFQLSRPGTSARPKGPRSRPGRTKPRSCSDHLRHPRRSLRPGRKNQRAPRPPDEAQIAYLRRCRTGGGHGTVVDALVCEPSSKANEA
jgi:ParB/RepB/Spo0J family partition protein